MKQCNVEGLLPFMAEMVVEEHRMLVKQREVLKAWKVADRRGKVFERTPQAKPKAERVVMGPTITPEQLKEAKAWVRSNRTAEQEAALVQERARWAGYWDNICKFVGGKECAA